MIFCVILVLALIDCKFATHLVDAAQLYETTANNVGGKQKRNAETGCQLPAPLKNGDYTPSPRRCRKPQDFSPACRMIPGTWVPKDWPIFYECDPGYMLKTDDGIETTGRGLSSCANRQWNPTLPVCVETHYNNKNLPNFLSSKDVCGKPAKLGKHPRTKRNVQGNISRKGAWPWMVIFGMHKNNTQNGGIHWFCAGTLITTRHILTAAHCVADYRKKNAFFARFNDINLDDPSDNVGAIEIEIQRNNIIPHPGFKKEKVFSHNLAIIRLTSNIQITEFVKPICLPTPDFIEKSFDDETAYFASWGQTDNDREWNRKRNYQPILHELKSTIVNHADCNYNYRNYQSDDFVIISWELICAAVPINKSCQGDAGSPLMLKIKDKYVLIGVVATPFRCYDDKFPRLFTRLSTYMDWIVPNLKF